MFLIDGDVMSKVGGSRTIKILTLNPRRLWLRHHRANEISQKTASFLPERYDAGITYAGIRKNGAWQIASLEIPVAENETPFITTPDFETAATNKATPWSNSAISGAEAAALYGGGTFLKFQQVDDYVYTSMSHLAGKNVETLSDLNATLGEYKHDFWGNLSDKALDKWKGHLAEPHVADHLTDAGYQIEWPESSNQEGWDFLLNGHEVNSKLVADLSGLNSHFVKFPDIAVIVPHDTDLAGAENVFHFDPSQGLDSGLSEFLSSSAPHKIIVDEALSSADITNQASDAADIAIGGTAQIDAHIPWITVATAGWREGRLLYGNKTDFKSAGKNLASDVAGKGGGAFVGAKAGAVAGASIGSFFGPGPGTAVGGVIGGIIGSIGGAIVGGKASAKFKRMDLDSAIDTTIAAQSSLKSLQEQLERTSNTEFRDAKARQQNELNYLRQQEQEKINSTAAQLKKWRESANKLTVLAAEEWINQGESEITQCVNSLKLYLKKQGFWNRWIWPSINVVALEQATEILNSNLERFKLFSVRLSEGEMIGIEDLFVLFSETGTLRQQVYSRLEIIDKERLEREGNLRSAIESSYQTLLKRRQQAFSELSVTATKITENIKRSLSPRVKEMSGHVERINIEKAKLGMS